MNAEELMLGDYVSYDNSVYKVLSVDKVQDVNIYNDTDGYHYRPASEMAPIPLTPEVLEKNGFPFNEVETNSDIQDVYSHYTKFYDFPLGKGFYIEYDTVDNIFYITDHWWVRFKYVHEFQHILRLCNIDKEIIL